MGTPDLSGQTSPDEVLARWEGPAIHEPGVLSEDRQTESLAAGSDVAELAAWLAVTALAGASGDAAHAGIRAKALGVLSAWRRRFGPAKVEEVNRRLLAHMQQYRGSRKLTEEELRQRVERLFDDVPA